MTSSASKRQRTSTRVKTESFTFEWNIENFRLLPHKNAEILYSAPFSFGGNDVIWSLNLYPQGQRSTPDYVALFLALQSTDMTSEIKVDCKLALRKSNVVLAQSKFVKRFRLSGVCSWGRGEFIQREKLLAACADDDSFNIVCKLEQVVTTVTQSKKRCIPFNLEHHTLNEDYHKMKQSNQFSDVTLIAKTHKFPAHKFILTARSPVFAAMFAHKDLKDSRTNVVKINDIDPEVIEGMLEFIYTDQVTNLEALADRLIIASHNYELERLTTLCEKALYDSLDTQNAIDILIVADTYGSQQLLDEVIEFIANHPRQVTESGSYNKINDPELLKTLVHAVTQRN